MGAGPDLDATFKVVLFSVLGIVIVCFAALVVMAAVNAKNADSVNLASICSDGFKIGFGAIVGLLGGKKL